MMLDGNARCSGTVYFLVEALHSESEGVCQELLGLDADLWGVRGV